MRNTPISGPLSVLQGECAPYLIEVPRILVYAVIVVERPIVGFKDYALGVVLNTRLGVKRPCADKSDVKRSLPLQDGWQRKGAELSPRTFPECDASPCTDRIDGAECSQDGSVFPKQQVSVFSISELSLDSSSGMVLISIVLFGMSSAACLNSATAARNDAALKYSLGFQLDQGRSCGSCRAVSSPNRLRTCHVIQS